MCRKNCSNFIKLPMLKKEYSEDLEKFIDSVQIIPGMKTDGNTCIYPNWTLYHYIENKEQLKLYYASLPNYKDNVEKLIGIINWFSVLDIDIDIGNIEEISEMLTEINQN